MRKKGLRIFMKRKGFTLVELLAVIVILAVIALIATPMILGVIEKAKKKAAENSALGYIDAIEKQVIMNMTDGEATLTDHVYDVADISVSLKGNPPSSGWFMIEKGQITNYSFVIDGYVITFGKDTIKGDRADTKPKMYSIGDEVTVAGEPFYVISDAVSKVTLLAKYNVDTTTNKQVVSGATTIAFDETTNNYETATIKELVEAYTNSLGSNITGRLLTGLEVSRIAGFNWITVSATGGETITNPTWLYSTSYWLKDSIESKSGDAWCIRINGSFRGDRVGYDSYYGLRPVIEVPKSIVS